MQLTKEQAIIISGYTGVLCCEKFSDFHKDVENRLGRLVWTCEFGTKEMTERLKDLYREDFLNICYKGE